MRLRFATTLTGALCLLAATGRPSVQCERPVEAAGPSEGEERRGASPIFSEKRTAEKRTLAEAASAAGGGGALTLEASREVSKSWVCGDRTEFFYLFANALSGSNYGKRLVREKSRDKFVLTSLCAEVFITAMNDASAFQEAAQDLRERVETLKVLLEGWQAPERGPVARRTKMRLVRAIAIGGDGSFTWVVDTAQRAGVDLRFVAFGVLPAGTGNDLAHTFGWASFRPPSGDPLHPQNMQALVEAWRSSRVVKHDIWEAEVQVDEKTGFFDQWNNELRSRAPLGEDRRGSAHRKRFLVTNYFGLGFDGQVGSDFDQYRGKSRAFNRLLYLLLFLKNWPRRKVPVCDRVEAVFKLGAEPVALIGSGEKYLKVPRLQPCVSFTFLNVQTISGGVGLWAATERVGLLPPPDVTVEEDFQKYVDALSQQQIRSGDGLIQLFTMESATDYSTFLIAPENKAKKVLQSEGPLFVTLKKADSSLPADSEERLMPFQVDGEFFGATDMRSVKIENKHTINVLYRDK